MNPIDPGTGLTVLGGALGLKDIIIKIFGPTADYLGGGFQHWVEKRKNNFDLIISKAQAKLGAKINENGAIPPRILQGILSEGSMNDDRLAAEYFGGVLASSRSPSGRDDRGAAYIALLNGMSTYQIRTHYIMYTVLRHLFLAYHYNGDTGEFQKLEVFLPYSVYLPAMEFDLKEMDQFAAIFNHIIVGMNHQEILHQNYCYGPTEFIKKKYPDATEGGILWIPSILGIQLYLWAHGLGDSYANIFFDPSIKFEIQEKINILNGSKATKYQTSAPAG